MLSHFLHINNPSLNQNESSLPQALFFSQTLIVSTTFYEDQTKTETRGTAIIPSDRCAETQNVFLCRGV